MADLLPFVVEPPGDAQAAHRAAECAATKWGLPTPAPLRSGMSCMYTAGDDVVLRVCRTTSPPGQAVWLAGQLALRGVRVPRHVRDVPVVFEGLAVYAIERLEAAGPLDWAEVGSMIRRVHDWPAEEVRGHYPLPFCGDLPWWNAEAGLASVADLLDEGSILALRSAIETHGGWRKRASSRVVCHGDLHPGNLVQTATGPVLLDWDLLCEGPAAWDHAVVLTWEHRWGGDRGMYADFAAGYGESLAGDGLTESLAVMRNVIATIMRVKAGRDDPRAAHEAARRLRFWRGDADAPQWRPA